MKLLIKRLLNLITKSRLTSVLKIIEVAGVDEDDETKVKKEKFYASDMFSTIIYSRRNLKILSPNAFTQIKGTIGIIIDMYKNPSKQNRLMLVYKQKFESKSATTMQIQEKDTVLDIDGIKISEDDDVKIIYEYTLSKYNGYKQYTVRSDESIDVLLQSGAHVFGTIDTRLMYRKHSNKLGVFEYTALPLKIADSIEVICIDIEDILYIEPVKSPFEGVLDKYKDNTLISISCYKSHDFTPEDDFNFGANKDEK